MNLNEVCFCLNGNFQKGLLGNRSSRSKSRCFITFLLLFDLHFQDSFVENDFTLLFKERRLKSNKSQAKMITAKDMVRKERKNKNVKKLQQNTKSICLEKYKQSVHIDRIRSRE